PEPTTRHPHRRAGAGSVGGAGPAAGGAAAGSGALAAAGAGGLVALVTSAPLAAAAVTVGVLTVAGLSVAGALGAFSPDPAPTPTAQTSPSPSESPTATTGTTTTPDPTTDPTSPTNIPLAPTDETAAGTGDTTGTGGGSPTDGTTPVGSTPGTTTPGGSADPGTGTPTPTDPGTGTPGPTDPGTPEPAPASLDLALGADVVLVARQPADVRMTVSNSGGRAAQNVAVEIDLPLGVETIDSQTVSRGASLTPTLRTAALPCGPSGSRGTLNCAVGVLAPGEVRDLVVTVKASGGGTYEFPARVLVDGVKKVERRLTPPPLDYVGAEVRLAEERLAIASNPGTANLTLRVANTGDRAARGVSFTVPDLPDGLEVRATDDAWTCTSREWTASLTCERDVALSEPERGVGAGPEVSLGVELRSDGSYNPAVDDENGALRVLPTSLPVEVRAGGDTGGVSAKRSMTAAVPLAWLGAEDMHVRAENVDGDVRYVAEVVNDTGAPATVDLVGPDTPGWEDVELSERTTVRDQAVLVVDANASTVPAGMLVVRQERLLVGPDGPMTDRARDVILNLPKHSIAPAVPEPVVGQCEFDLATDTSSADVTLVYDNSASTLPVVFSVDGRPGLSKTVAAREMSDVELPRAGAAAATYMVRADGRELGPRTVRAVDCFQWSVTGSAMTRWSAESKSFVIEGSFRNAHVVTPMSVVLEAGRHGSTDAVEVAPGAEASFAIDTGSRDVAAGSVTFRSTRVGASGAEPHELDAPYTAARYAPSASQAPSVGECVFDAETDTSTAPVTVYYDNSASTVPVDFSVAGRDDLTATLKAGEVRDVVVPRATGGTFEVLADGSAIARHDVPGVDCFEWNVSGRATAGWVPADGGGSVVVTGAFDNRHSATTLRVVMDAGVLGTTKAVDVAPGAEASFTLDTGSRDVAAGSVTFRATRVGASGAKPHEVRASYDAARYAPSASRAPSVGECVFDAETDTSSAPVTVHYDNSASTVPVEFSVAGRDGLTVTLKAGEVRDVVVPGGVGATSATFEVRADGSTIARHDVAGVDCFEWNVSGSATTRWSAETRSVVVQGEFRNGHATTALRVTMDGDELGVTKAVDVAPGERVTVSLDTGSRDVAAGEVVFHATRLDGSGRSHAVSASFDAVRHAPAVGSPVVGKCVLDPKTELSSATVSLRYDNTRSTVPVVFSVEGRKDLTRAVDGGAAVTVDVPGGVGQERLRLAVLADGTPLASHAVAAVDCFDWKKVAHAADAETSWVVAPGTGVGTSVVTGTFRNPYAATTLRVGMSTPHGDAAPVEVAPGAEATFRVDAKALSVPAGAATFTVERAAPSGPGRETVEARYRAHEYSPEWARGATVAARGQGGAVNLGG
ncbi:hypothetical protein ACWFQT_18855, partial [Cellulosimicrobium cellulans]